MLVLEAGSANVAAVALVLELGAVIFDVVAVLAARSMASRNLEFKTHSTICFTLKNCAC